MMSYVTKIQWLWAVSLIVVKPPNGMTRAGDLGHNYRASNTPTVYVLENATVGSVIVPDIRTHLGLPTTSLVKLGPGSLNQFFRLDSDSGQLITVAPLDLESATICQAEKSCCRQEIPEADRSMDSARLAAYVDPMGAMGAHVGQEYQTGDTCRMMAFILSRSGADNQLTPVTRLYVTVVDLNDNAPVFRVVPDDAQRTATDMRNSFGNHIPTVKLAFSEGPAGLHSRHDLPTAFDADFSAANRVKRYWLEWNSVRDKTSPDPTNARNHGDLLNVLNIDDQNGLTWATLGPFRLIFLEPGRSIALELDAELDRELQSSYQLRLVAEDGGRLRGQMFIDIDVIDVNEYAPVFADNPPTKEQLKQNKPHATYRKRYSVKESLTVGSELGQLRAYDADRSPGTEITYRLGPGNPPNEVANTFQIHPLTGVLKLAGSLDYESIQQYRLTVIAQDGPSLETNQAVSSRVASTRTQTAVYRSATAIVEITVIDINDNAPTIRFDKEDTLQPPAIRSDTKDSPNSNYDVWINEDLPKGSPVTFFSVSDRDLAENGRVTCSLMNWTERFRLREFAGLYGVETMDLFDREKLDTYHVTIRCQDHGIPAMETDRSLIVHLKDVNDLPPTFQLPVYQFHVLENSPPGTPLKPISANFPSAVTASDPDLNSTIKYYLESRSAGPKSPNSILSEMMNSGSPGTTDHELFHIDPTSGVLTTQGELDREERGRLSFQVCADDGKHVTCTDVIVQLDDVNDNPPRFDRDTYVIRVEENQLSHKPILTFRVTDADAGNHGFMYEFLDENLSTFESKRSSNLRNHTSTTHDWEQYEPGSVRYHFALRDNTLYVRRPLDRELRSNYHFFVTATDSQDLSRSLLDGLPQKHVYTNNLTSKAEIFIDVGDVNDNAPIFIFPNSTGPSGNRLSISCHETMGSSVGRLQASDPDLGPNATVVFSLIHTPEVDQLFYLDAQSGELFVNTGQLAEKCGNSLIVVVSVDDQGPIESKKSRPAPVERMLIKLEDKPTLAELIAAEARQQWRVLSDTSSDGRIVKHSDGSVETSMQYGVLSTRTILSVVLGGSTVFLIGLLIVWLILLLYNRSRRRKQARSQGRRISGKPHLNPGSPQSVLSVESPEKGALFGTLNSGKNDNHCCPDQFVRNAVQNDKTDTVAIHHPASVAVDFDYYRCLTDPEIGYLTSKDSNYGKYSMRRQASPTITSRISSSPQNTGTEAADYATTRLWHPDRELYHTRVPEQCRMGMTAPTSHSTMRRSPGGMELATISRDHKATSTFGRLLPRWIVNNIVPRQQTNKDGYARAKQSYTLREKRSVHSPVVNNIGSLNLRPASTTQDIISSPQKIGRLARMLEKPEIPHSSVPGCSIDPNPSTLAYTTVRSCTLKHPTDRFAPNGLNNQSSYSRGSYPFLTPPANRREAASWRTGQYDRSPQTALHVTKGDYTSLLRPAGTDCGPGDGHPARPSSSIPMLSYSEHPPPLVDFPSTGTRRQPTIAERSNSQAHRFVATPTDQVVCSVPNSYPCCSACDPLLPENSSLLGSCDLLNQGGDQFTDLSIQNCPQCRMMGGPLGQPSCCGDNCSLLQAARHPISSHELDRAGIVTGQAVPALGSVEPQCSTTAYMSMQEMLNSCV